MIEKDTVHRKSAQVLSGWGIGMKQKERKTPERNREAETTSVKKTNWFAWILFVAYLWLLFYLLFFSESYGRTDVVEEYRYNLELFKEIKRFWNNWETIGIQNVMINLAGNIAAFVPFGLLFPMICNRGKRCVCCVVMTALFSLFVEMVQLVSKVGAFDVDDIFLNTIGGLVGFLGYQILFRIYKGWYKK